jgi:cytochrome c peroxidase
LPPGFPALEVPADNALSSERVALGRMLFYDPILSRDSSISCGSCHLQAAAFTDGTRISPGVEGRLGTRNTPTLVNLAYQPYFFAEGGSPTLELQSIGPIEAQHEMDLPIGEAVQRLQQSPRYANLAEQAYQRPMDVFVITRALAAFERTLISGHSPYDRFIRQHQTDALSAEAQRGMTLFFSEQSGCGSCHNGLHLTDYQFYNLGLSATDQADLGRYRLTLDSADIGAFKTPSLRNVALTAPYMHDGSLPTLRSVIEHFDQGGKGHRLQSPLVRPLHLTDQQKDDLLAFLQALTDARFLSDPAYAPLP